MSIFPFFSFFEHIFLYKFISKEEENLCRTKLENDECVATR